MNTIQRSSSLLKTQVLQYLNDPNSSLFEPVHYQHTAYKGRRVTPEQVDYLIENAGTHTLVYLNAFAASGRRFASIETLEIAISLNCAQDGGCGASEDVGMSTDDKRKGLVNFLRNPNCC